MSLRIYLPSPLKTSALHSFSCVYGLAENVQNEVTILTMRRKYQSKCSCILAFILHQIEYSYTTYRIYEIMSQNSTQQYRSTVQFGYKKRKLRVMISYNEYLVMYGVHTISH